MNLVTKAVHIAKESSGLNETDLGHRPQTEYLLKVALKVGESSAMIE